jgi:hypothetical protein
MSDRPRTRGDVRRLIHEATQAAATLTKHGHREYARLLTELADIARHRLDPYHGGDDIVGDLFDGKAA